MKTQFRLSRYSRNSTFAALAAVSLLLCVPTHAEPARLEYTVANAKLKNRNLEALLNGYAGQGWELVQITYQGIAIFKRSKKQ